MDLKKITVGQNGGKLHIGRDLVAHTAQTVVSELPAQCYCIIAEGSVEYSQLKRNLESCLLKKTGETKLLQYQLPAIHNIKTRTMKADIEDWLLSNMCKRDTVLISVGGEALGELVGFVAATYMRGIRYCCVPTTLLSMIDTSIGGKTGIDVSGAQNAIGAFHHAAITFVDTARPGLFEGRTFLSGMAEIVKIACVASAALFESIEANAAAIIKLSDTPQELRSVDDLQIVNTIVREAISQKAQIVESDPKEESGLRSLLNFGHTIGHVIEGLAHGTLLHGECVAIGIMLEAEVSQALGHLTLASMDRLRRCMQSLHLPTSFEHPLAVNCPSLQDIPVSRFLRLMKLDKKASGGQIDIVMLREIGKVLEQRATTVSMNVLQDILLERLPRRKVIDKVAPGLPYARYPKQATILITGMRGSGKSYLAKEASRVTGMQVLDADEEIERRLGESVGEYVKVHGWSGFRKVETDLLQDILEKYPTGYVVSLGGGIVESVESRKLMLAWMQQGGPVVHIIRDVEETFAYLNVDVNRPSLGEDLHTIYARRKPYYEQCSSYQVMNNVGWRSASEFASTKADTSDASSGSLLEAHRFFQFITGVRSSVIPDTCRRSKSLLLDTTDISKILPYLSRATKEVDAIEVYVDCLGKSSNDGKYLPDPSLVTSQIIQLRHNSRLPLVYTVRSPRVADKLDINSWDQVLDLYLLGIRLGCEMVTIDVEWDIDQLQDIISYRGYTKLIASYCGPLQWSNDEVLPIYQKAQKFGDVIRLYSLSQHAAHDTRVLQAKASLPATPPLIACDIDPHVNKASLIFNQHLTPVVNEDVPLSGNYSFMSNADLEATRKLLAL